MVCQSQWTWETLSGLRRPSERTNERASERAEPNGSSLRRADDQFSRPTTSRTSEANEENVSNGHGAYSTSMYVCTYIMMNGFQVERPPYSPDSESMLYLHARASRIHIYLYSIYIHIYIDVICL